MHYLAFVLIPKDAASPQDAVERVMAPHSEHTSGSGFWDYWSIGGRWSGHLDGYDPEKDPRNHETCNLCNGTGTRRDEVAQRHGIKEGYCNGCSHDSSAPVGVRVKWPTQWAQHGGDVVPASVAADAPDDKMPYAIVGDEAALLKKSWNGEDFVPTDDFDAKAREMLAAHNGMVAVVDYHS